MKAIHVEVIAGLEKHVYSLSIFHYACKRKSEQCPTRNANSSAKLM